MAKHTPCTQCGTLFPATGNWRRCPTCRTTATGRRNTNGSRQGISAVTRRPGTFIAVDGEGYTRPDGTHHYTMLSVGDRTLTDPNGEHLDVVRIFEFLWECFEADRSASYIGFFLGYDFTQWVRTLPEYKAWKLLHKDGIHTRRVTRERRGGNATPFPVDFLDWEFDQLTRVRFKLRRKGAKAWMYICDVGPYFQTSFLNVINPAQWTDPVCTDSEYRTLVEGKETRGDVQTPEEWVALYPETERYNRTENRILAAVMDRMKTGLVAERIELDRKQWFGPGQAAQEWLNVIGQPTGILSRTGTPEAVLRAAQSSYYGGWFEIFAHGHLAGDTYEYDINSAYPAAMTHLPCTTHGQWTHQTRAALTLPYTLCRVRVTGSNPMIGAMQCRRPDYTIARPHVTEGWYWAHELAAAKRAGLIDTIKWFEAWVWRPGDCPGTTVHEGKVYQCRALAKEVPDMYERRMHGPSSFALGAVRLFIQQHLSDLVLPSTLGSTPPSSTGDGCKSGRATLSDPAGEDTNDGSAAQRTESTDPKVRYLRMYVKQKLQQVNGSTEKGIPTGGPERRSSSNLELHASTAESFQSATKSITVSPSAAVAMTRWITSQLPADPAIDENVIGLILSSLPSYKNTPHGKAMKVALNSCYGKLAQSVGNPQFGNAFHASFITSWCRTKILDAIATHPDGAAAVVMIATDGIYFRAPHPGLDLEPGKLGAWEASVKRNLTLLKPGVYWDDAARERLAEGNLPKIKSRGISAADLAANLLRIDEEFRSAEFLRGDHWPTIDIKIRFNLIGAKSAITRGRWGLAGQIEWADGTPHRQATRQESAAPAAKRFLADWWTDRHGDHRTGVWSSATASGESTPYDQAFGWNMLEEDPRYTELPDTPDGPTDYLELIHTDDPKAG